MKRSFALIVLTMLAAAGDAFVIVDGKRSQQQHQQQQQTTCTNYQSSAPPLTIAQGSLASRHYARNKNDRYRQGGRGSANDRTKRQERVGTLVQSELSRILHKGVIRGDAEYLDDDLRQRISVVSADVSPDLKQARISVSVRGPNKRNIHNKSGQEQLVVVDEDEDEDMEDEDLEDDDEDLENEYIEDAHDPAVDTRRAYSWLVRNTKPIRHTLAQRMSHMKSCPNLSFVQVDVAAATDVMYLIDKVAAGYKRERIGGYNENDMPTGVLSGMDFDEDYDDDEWDEDDDFFDK